MLKVNTTQHNIPRCNSPPRQILVGASSSTGAGGLHSALASTLPSGGRLHDEAGRLAYILSIGEVCLADLGATFADVVTVMAYNKDPGRVYPGHPLPVQRVAERDGRCDVRGRGGIELVRRVVHQLRALGVAGNYNARVGAVCREGLDDARPVFGCFAHPCQWSCAMRQGG